MPRNERNGQMVYRGNGALCSRWRGRRIQDDVTGLWFDADFATTDDFGDVIDARNPDSFDYDTGAVGGNENPLRGPFGPF